MAARPRKAYAMTTITTFVDLATSLILMEAITILTSINEDPTTPDFEKMEDRILALLNSIEVDESGPCVGSKAYVDEKVLEIKDELLYLSEYRFTYEMVEAERAALRTINPSEVYGLGLTSIPLFE